MALDTFAHLKTSIGDWMMRRDLTSVIPDLITLAEARMNRELRIRQMIVRDTIVAPSTDEAYENLPGDFLELKSIRFNTNPIVEPKFVTQQMIETLRGRYRGTGGTPRYYTIVNNQLLFETTPTGSPELELASYVKIPALSDAQTANAILTQHPDLYLFAALSQAANYMDRDERVPTWEAKYGNALDMAHAADRQSELGPGPLVQRPTRWF